jgi:hypothetical protein
MYTFATLMTCLIVKTFKKIMNKLPQIILHKSVSNAFARYNQL